jgi:hypothetical protein
MLTSSPSLDESRSVTDIVVEGNRLYYQGIPSEAQTIRLYYYRKPNDMASYTSNSITFSGTTISDSNNGLGVFKVGSKIDISNAYRNNGSYTISSVESDGSSMVVDSEMVDIGARNGITIRSRPDGIPEHVQKDLIVNNVVFRYLKKSNVRQLAVQYKDKFMGAMLDLEIDKENMKQPMVVSA